MNLSDLYAIICDRRDHPRPGSYTASLFAAGEDEILKKVGEESVEVILAAARQGDRRLVEETADLAYHMLVLLVQRGIPLEAIADELEKRHRTPRK
jgi:phosphoribosyl-ATP pyrophosphohydrolase